jgi:MFS family permease
MSGHHRAIVAALILLGILALVLLVAFAGNACPVETEAQPCPDATRNVIVAIVIASGGVALMVTPFAFLAEFVARRRIVYRGAWFRAARRGVLVGLVLAALAGLRLGGALSVAVAIFIVTLAVAAEWLLARRDA